MLVSAATICAAACADSDPKRLKDTTKPSYDPATGKLRELTYDANGNGRIDTWTEMDGARPVRSRIDRDEDGRIDRWEYYDAQGRLAKVGFSRNGAERPDAWAYSATTGGVARVEISSAADERKIDRWEYYDASGGTTPDQFGVLVRAEEDSNGDGRPDKWETYDAGEIRTVAFDENADGRPDRRLSYRGSEIVLIETEPDETGRFAKKVEVKP